MLVGFGEVRGARGARAQRTACDGLCVRTGAAGLSLLLVDLGLDSHHLAFWSPSRRLASIGCETCYSRFMGGGGISFEIHNNNNSTLEPRRDPINSVQCKKTCDQCDALPPSAPPPSAPEDECAGLEDHKKCKIKNCEDSKKKLKTCKKKGHRHLASRGGRQATDPPPHLEG